MIILFPTWGLSWNQHIRSRSQWGQQDNLKSGKPNYQKYQIKERNSLSCADAKAAKIANKRRMTFIRWYLKTNEERWKQVRLKNTKINSLNTHTKI